LVPTTWDVPMKRNVRWRTPIPGLSHASPVIWGDRVYVVGARPVDGDASLDMKAEGVVFAPDVGRQAWTLYALDRDAGRIVWERRAHEAAPVHARHVRGTYANATPATNGRYIAAKGCSAST
jgi:outer membrane protein assembly factor BamB